MWNQFLSCSKRGGPEQSHEKPLVPLKEVIAHIILWYWHKDDILIFNLKVFWLILDG